MLILSLSSVFGLVLAAIFLHEHISIFQIIAAGIMLFGIYLINRNRNVKVTPDSYTIPLSIRLRTDKIKVIKDPNPSLYPALLIFM